MAVAARAGDRAAVQPALISWLLVLGLGFVVTFGLATGWDPPLTVPPLINAGVWWDQGWPVLLGLILAAAGWALSRLEVLPGWAAHPDGRTVPPGDMVVVEEQWLCLAVWSPSCDCSFGSWGGRSSAASTLPGGH